MIEAGDRILPDNQNSHISTRLILTRSLKGLHEDLVNLGKKVQQSLDMVISSISMPNEYLISQLEKNIKEIDEFSIATEEKAFTTLTLQQPLLGDLRMVVGILKVSSQFDHIAQYLKDIANITASSDVSQSSHLLKMAENTAIILDDLLDALTNNSVEITKTVNHNIEKNKVNADLAIKDILQHLVHDQTEEQREQNISPLTALRLLERVNDRLNTINSEIYYIYTGNRI